jgi:hypothetical protein
MTTQFTTFAPEACYYKPEAETLAVGTVYKVRFAGETVRARFLGTENQTFLSRGLRHAAAFRKWERV